MFHESPRNVKPVSINVLTVSDDRNVRNEYQEVELKVISLKMVNVTY